MLSCMRARFSRPRCESRNKRPGARNFAHGLVATTRTARHRSIWHNRRGIHTYRQSRLWAQGDVTSGKVVESTGGGSGGGKGGGGNFFTKFWGSDNEENGGNPAWGSLLVGCILGGSLCLNFVLLGWDLKSKNKGKNSAIEPSVEPEPIFTASYSAPTEMQPKEVTPTVISSSRSENGVSFLAVLLLLAGGGYVLYNRKRRRQGGQNGIVGEALDAQEKSEDITERTTHSMDANANVGGLMEPAFSGRSPSLAMGPSTSKSGQTHPQNAHTDGKNHTSVIPIPVVVPFPIPYPMPSGVGGMVQPINVATPHTPSATTVVVNPAQGAVVEDTVAVRPTRDVIDEDLLRHERERHWKRILDYVTPNIRDEYEFGGFLGRGSTSIVRSVTKKSTGEQFACKSISKSKLTTVKDEEDVKGEIKVMYHLAGNPNIVQLYGVYEDQRNIHLVLDYCRGGELFDTIVTSGNYTERDAAKVMKVILNVVAHCHGLGVIHRDIKPENFLWMDVESTNLKAIDFGMSSFFKPGEVFRDLVGSKYTVAPEVLRRSYSYQADIWSCGVIMYWILSGVPPFLGQTLRDAFDNILIGEIDYESPPWPHISPQAKDCLGKMLQYMPKDRWSAEELLRHEWVNGVAPDVPIGSIVLERWQEFGGMNRLQQVARKVIAERLPMHELEGLKNMFEAMDADRNGMITIDEIIAEMKRRKVGVDPVEFAQILKGADLDGNGEIQFQEFLAATLNAVELRKEENLMLAFEHFDSDGSGYITPEELREALLEIGETDNLDEILAAVDTDQDGRIDYNEFKEMMLGEHNV